MQISVPFLFPSTHLSVSTVENLTSGERIAQVTRPRQRMGKRENVQVYKDGKSPDLSLHVLTLHHSSEPVLHIYVKKVPHHSYQIILSLDH